MITDPKFLNPPIGNHKQKRIVMNPPETFIAQAALNPNGAGQGSGLIDSNGSGTLMITPFGQAIMQSTSQPQSQQNTNTNTNQFVQSQGGDVVLQGSAIVLEDSGPVSTPPSSAMTMTMATTAIQSTRMNSAISAAAITPTASITSDSAVSPASTTTSIGPNSTTLSMTTTTNVSNTNTPSLSASSMTGTSTTGTAPTPTSTSSITPAPSASSGASATGGHHTPSVGLILVIILSCLVLFAILASSLSFIFRSRRLNRFRFPCMRHRDDDDDDGLSDLVRSFESPPSNKYSQSDMIENGYGHGASTNPYSTAGAGVGLGLGLGTSHISNMHPHDDQLSFEQQEQYQALSTSREREEADANAELERRSALFAKNPNASPFLHSASMSGHNTNSNTNIGNYPMPLAPPLAHGNSMRSNSTAFSLPFPGTRGQNKSHLMGEIGPLEVRNGMPDEQEYEDQGVEGLHEIGLGSASPRFLGLDGNGLETPWSNLPPRPDEIDNDQHQSQIYSQGNVHLPIPLPLTMTNSTSQPPYGSFASPAPSVHEEIPQQSATWASNLRSTLFAAISAVKQPNGTNNGGGGGGRDWENLEGQGVGEDKFTRTVGMITKRRNPNPIDANVNANVEKGGFPIVSSYEDEKSNFNFNSIFLSRIESCSSEETLTPNYRGSASERYKTYYARSKSSINLSSMASIDGEGDGEGEESSTESIVVKPPVLAGGARAKGAKTGSFVVA